ncbi:MAG: DUF501 domain-containing protein [Propionibacteriaceae bacterium]|jgi:hypothetical protein|nr:DUF501 domain-containing protein [Propionibacteriaceae bacterium]
MSLTNLETPSQADLDVIGAQLGREPRAVVGVAWRCPSGQPGVIATEPRLPGGAPFPTFYYLTCPKLVAECSRLESAGLMAQFARRLAAEPELAAAYRAAHDSYLADRAEYGDVPQIAGISAGGMPDRVKCLHALLAHALARPGVNPIGAEVAAMLGVG